MNAFPARLPAFLPSGGSPFLEAEFETAKAGRKGKRLASGEASSQGVETIDTGKRKGGASSED